MSRPSTSPGPRVRVTVTGKDGTQQILEADKVLQAIGFAPNVTGYGLENTGVRVTERGAIDVDGRCRTSVPHMYAIGDVTAKLMLAHAAEAMGIIAAETIADAETMELDYAMIPRATFCQPQIASFGYTEAQARELGYDVKVTKFPFTANGKSHGLGDTTASSSSSATPSKANSSVATLSAPTSPDSSPNSPSPSSGTSPSTRSPAMCMLTRP